MSADAAADAADAADADADAAAERRLNHSIPRTYFVRGIQLHTHLLRKFAEVTIIIYANVFVRIRIAPHQEHYEYFMKAKIHKTCRCYIQTWGGGGLLPIFCKFIVSNMNIHWNRSMKIHTTWTFWLSGLTYNNKHKQYICLLNNYILHLI